MLFFSYKPIALRSMTFSIRFSIKVLIYSRDDKESCCLSLILLSWCVFLPWHARIPIGMGPLDEVPLQSMHGKNFIWCKGCIYETANVILFNIHSRATFEIVVLLSNIVEDIVTKLPNKE